MSAQLSIATAHAELEPIVRHIIFQAGGINSASRRRLAALAAVHRLSNRDLHALINAVGSAEVIDLPEHVLGVHQPDVEVNASQAELGAALLPAAAGESIAPSESRVRSRNVRIAAILLLTLSALLGVRLVAIVAQSLVEAPIDEVVVGSAPVREATAVTASQAASLQAMSLPAASGLDERELFQALANLDERAFSQQPDAARAIFDRSVAALSEQWLTLDAELVEDVTVLLRDAIAAAGAVNRSPSVPVGMTDELLAPSMALVERPRALDHDPSAIAFSSAWACAVDTTRLPPPAEGRVRALRIALPREATRRVRVGDFWRGASLGLERLALEYAEAGVAQGSWEAFADAAESVAKANQEAGLTALVRALGHLVHVEGASAPAAPARKATGVLIERIDWRTPQATQALLGWFESRKVSSAQLAFVVRELAESRLIPGLPTSTRLDADADAEARTRVRDAFALSLGEPLRATDAFAMRWRRAVESHRALEPPRGPEAVRHALSAAYLCAAAAQRTAGADGPAEHCVDQALAALETPLVAPSAWPEDVRLGRWGESFLGARRDEQARIELLYLLMNEGGPATQLEADLLAETAAFGAPRSVQRLAQRIIIDLPDDARIIDGLLKALPKAATSNEGLAEVIARTSGGVMPPAGDAAWRRTAQRLLIERLLELQAHRTKAPVGDAPAQLADAYELSLAALPALDVDQLEQWAQSTPEASTLPADDPAVLAAALWSRWHARAERLPEGATAIAPLTELAARRTGRLALARGPVQRFAAEQASIAELIAYTTAIEQPVRAEAAAAIVRTMRAEGRTAVDIYQQMALNERAILRLWALRLGIAEAHQ